MGLIGVSLPQGLNDDLFFQQFVLVGYTENEIIKLFYSAGDDPVALKKLLMNNDIPEGLAGGFIAATGKHVPNDTPSHLATKLPGVLTLSALHPVKKQKMNLYDIIISLNDTFDWKREEIADWIENTFDTKDIAFQAPEGVTHEKGILSETTKVVKIKRFLPS